ncbi:zinc ribbon domain-containing protein [Clostridium sp. BSD9I1]|uniref:zinc ribbon domain-containing protein n=1 Tax=Clostridium sp. BSD9I1 TaxID=2003589 RepID=UPI001648EBC8|nr:zinc ribbon domain-containing protein [Clostridium sp. BSD9I1]
MSRYIEGVNETLLKNWSYYDLQQKIKYEAEENGIEVNFINPYCTSFRCSLYGNIDKENRDCKNNQAKFECIICGHKENADINAARNISLPNIEDIIKEQFKVVNGNLVSYNRVVPVILTKLVWQFSVSLSLVGKLYTDADDSKAYGNNSNVKFGLNTMVGT